VLLYVAMCTAVLQPTPSECYVIVR